LQNFKSFDTAFKIYCSGTLVEFYYEYLQHLKMSANIVVLVPSLLILVIYHFLSVKIMYNSHRQHAKTKICGLSDLYQSFERRNSDDGGDNSLLKVDSYLPYYITVHL